MRDVELRQAIDRVSAFAGKVAGELGGNADDTTQVTRTDFANFLLYLALDRGPLTEEIVARIVRITGDDIEDLKDAEDQVRIYGIDSDEFAKTVPGSFRQMVSADTALDWLEEEYSVSQGLLKLYNAVGNILFVKNQKDNAEKLSASIALIEYLQMMTDFRENREENHSESEKRTGNKTAANGVPAPEKR